MIEGEQDEWVDISMLGSMYREQMTVTGVRKYRHQRAWPVELAENHWTPGRRPDLPRKS